MALVCLTLGLGVLTQWPQLSGRVGELPAIVLPLSKIETSVRASFSLCRRAPHRDCVMDGDTFYLGSQSIRMVGIDAPESHPPRCAREARLGAQAAHRLLALLNAGPFDLERSTFRDSDIYGRKLWTVTRNGRSLRDTLISEGLARAYGSGRKSWCA
jgi:endonuclease YncB( thermonuclease family)